MNAAVGFVGGHVVRHAVHAMGTRFEFVVAHERESFALAAAEAAGERVLELHARWSAFQSDSVVVMINRDAAARPVRVDEETFALLQLCEQVWRESGGAFDVTVGPLMRAWGMRETPAAGVQAAVDAVVGFGHVRLDEVQRSVAFDCAGIELDLGAVAKGWALDAAAEVLREAGVSCALLHGGTSSVLGIGAPPGGGGWRVAVSDDAGAPVVELRDSALSVSAPHGRVIGGGGSASGEGVSMPAQLSHVIDPRTRRPVAPCRAAVVLAVSAAVADAWATAVLIDQRLPDSAAGVRAVVQALDGRWRHVGSTGASGDATFSAGSLPKPLTA